MESLPNISRDDVVFPGRENGSGEAKKLFESLMDAYAKRIIIRGLENIPEKGAFLIVANHQSHADGPFIWRALWSKRDDVWAIAGKVVAESRIRDFYLDSYPGLVYVERREEANPREAALIAKFAFSQEEGLLKIGIPFIVFSESRRSQTGGLIKAQWRTIAPALLADVPIVTCGIIGTDKIFPFRESLVTIEEMKELAKNVNPVEELSISFSEPILFSEYLPKRDDESFNIYAKKCMDIVMCEMAYKLLPEHMWGFYSDMTREYILKKESV